MWQPLEQAWHLEMEALSTPWLTDGTSQGHADELCFHHVHSFHQEMGERGAREKCALSRLVWLWERRLLSILTPRRTACSRFQFLLSLWRVYHQFPPSLHWSIYQNLGYS